MRPSPLAAQTALTFTDYFKLNLEIEDVLAYFGYTFQSITMALPKSTEQIPWFADLHNRIQASLPYISLTSEAARREFLIAPILIDLARYNHVKVKVELPIEVSDQLRGTLDYFIQAKHNLLVIEAKNADLQRGFTQLSAELIALHQWVDTDAPIFYGAVSIGNVWQFGRLNRAEKHIQQDLNLYRVPTDLYDLLQILLAILGEDQQDQAVSVHTM